MILGEEPIGGQVRQWRVNLGLSIADASRAAGITPGVWSRIESGVTPNPAMETVIKIFRGMGAQIDIKALPKDRKWQQDPLPTPTPAQPKKRSRVRADG